MPGPRDTRMTRWSGIAAVLLLVAAVMYLGLFRIVDSTERHAYNRGWFVSEQAALTGGRSYQLSVRGGAETLSARQADPAVPQCSWLSNGSKAQPLTVTPLARDSHALNVVGLFVAPVTGPVHIECANWGPVSIDDSDDSGVDLAGFFVLLAIGSSTAGAILGMSLLYQRASGPGGRHIRDSDPTAAAPRV